MQPVAATQMDANGKTNAVATAEAHLLHDRTMTPLLGAVAEETPVALVYNGISHAVMMATPLDLEDFALGFSLSEGILAGRHELLDVEIDEAPQGLLVRMTISARRFAALKERRRNLTGRTGCGLCGVDSLDQAVRPLAPLQRDRRVAAESLRRAIDALPDWQVLNRAARALHAAAWAGRDGNIRMVREDVGRHNALDKLIGALAAAGVDLADGFALITSRCSYEMVQKAVTTGMPMLAAISAPTALAVRMADAAHLTMIALARADGMRVYSHPEYIAGTASGTSSAGSELSGPQQPPHSAAASVPRRPSKPLTKKPGQRSRSKPADAAPNVQLDRRGFMRLAGLGGAGASLGIGACEATAAASERKDGDYRETEHVQTYYRLARF
ncbi:MAG TPA: formate dehydrogenase accessory sulfurtransferase FdhD [Pseudolabrys sp.]|nr:formate dehydrogenase accessory sulfurtransferase FdhD [Pseudolabrys sp.]